ncbi:hypothetical protein GU243_10855 [Pseudarthrobacter psychrotolerans]|uniref:Preprotein translocase subunit SecB n=1 Tax=Pseudarthrobacter psychrotolerans TaxID=2697569 RepID=A0A6P1NTM1_9MICC|nr:hypothetical protein [Pseudarthrobacter psychrotolerans]QHK20151.1 hypothetical protein GU243_10855 [Pseudarthrobacter psychrotolerans]
MPENFAAPKDVTTYDDLQTLSDDASLAGLVFYEVRSVRRGAGLDDYIADERHEADDEDEENGRLSCDAEVYFRISADQTRIEVRQRVDIVSDEAFALHPYVRESVTAMSSKLGVTPIVLPLMRTFSVDELDPADAAIRMDSDEQDE